MTQKYNELKIYKVMQNNKDDFYIGWQPGAPIGILRLVRRSVFVIICLVLFISAMIALFQRKFSTAVFEYGQLTEVKGIYHQFPVPSLKVVTKKDAFGNITYLTLPLVGYGNLEQLGSSENWKV
jgi:hypothetical protein